MFDLRDYLQKLEETGELITIDEEVNWNCEAAALSAMGCRAGAQAMHFKKLLGYPKGYSLATNLFAGPPMHHPLPAKRTTQTRFLTSLGIDPTTPYEGVLTTIADRYTHTVPPIKLSTGSCKEVIKTGEDINLLEFPIPFLHQEDAGRYGTGHVLIVKDPESDWQNWSVFRWKVLSPNTLVGNAQLSRDATAIRRKYEAQNKPMPFAIVIGGAPAILMAAAMKVPPMISEVEYAGGLNLDPINLVQAETSELLIPADAEIVIEGETIPGQFVDEGPYGGIHGYTRPCSQPLMRVKAITHRRNPILTAIVDGTEVNDTEVIISTLESVRLWKELTVNYQYPVRWVNLIPDFKLGLCVISIRPLYFGLPFRVARTAFILSNIFDKILFVDYEVEPYGYYSITNTLVTKVHPARAFHVIHGFPPALSQWYITEERAKTKGAGRLYIVGSWPAEWSPEDKAVPVTFESSFPAEVRDKVLKGWKTEYGFKEDTFVVPEGMRFEI